MWAQQSLWPAHPQPLDEELLSSWIIRLAYANGFKVQTFAYGYFNAERQFWTRDVDKFDNVILIETLIQRTGVSRERIEAMSLRSYCGFVFEDMPDLANTRWLMQLGMRARAFHLPGLVFCSQCFKEDKEPYLRRSWRMAWTTVCARHQSIVHERCPSCQAVLQPHRADRSYKTRLSSGTTIATCAQCGLDLRECQPPGIATAGQVQRQQWFDSVARSGYATVGEHKNVHSLAFFNGVRLVLGLQTLVNRASKTANASRTPKFEDLSCSERNCLLDQTWELMGSWPANFVQYCAKQKAPFTGLISQRIPIPWWLQTVCDQFLRRNVSEVKLENIAEIERYLIHRDGACNPAREKELLGNYLSRYRLSPFRHLRLESIERFFRCVDEQIAASSGRDRIDWIRDRVMFQIAIACNCSQLTLRNFREGGATAAVRGRIDALGSSNVEHTLRWLDWYAANVRPSYGEVSCATELFLCGKGHSMSENSISARYVKAIKTAGLQEEIHSYKHFAARAVPSSFGAFDFKNAL